MQRQYPALVHRDPGSDYGVSFPDFPGCVSGGETLDEALNDAAEALAFHIEGMAEDGEAFPDPTPAEAALADARADGEGFVSLAMIPAALPGKAKRINITLPEDLVERVDAATNNRSAYIAAALRAQLAAASTPATSARKSK